MELHDREGLRRDRNPSSSEQPYIERANRHVVSWLSKEAALMHLNSEKCSDSIFMQAGMAIEEANRLVCVISRIFDITYLCLRMGHGMHGLVICSSVSLGKVQMQSLLCFESPRLTSAG